MARANRRTRRERKPPSSAPREHHELFGVIFSLAASVVLLSLASFEPADPVLSDAGADSANLVGLVGAHLADGLLAVLGVSAFLLVIALVYFASLAFGRRELRVAPGKAVGYSSLVLLGTALSHILLGEHTLLGHAPGGLLGEYAGGLFISLLSYPGSVVVISAGLLVALIASTGFSLVRSARYLALGLRALGRALGRSLAWAGRGSAACLASASKVSLRWLASQAREFAEALRQRPASDVGLDAMEPACASPGQFLLAPTVSVPPPLLGRREPVVVTSEPPPASEPVLESGPGPASEPTLDPEPEAPRAPEPSAKAGRSAKRFRDISREHEPEIIMPRPQAREPQSAEEEAPARPMEDYSLFELPGQDLLESEEQPEYEIDKERLHEMARRLEAKLADYNIQGRVAKIMPGPVVTMYEYEPGPGIKVARISNLSQDLALALEAISVRIIAPIPGRAVVGIEVSNKTRQTVYAKDIIQHSAFRRSKSNLTLALGKNIEGVPCVTDLNKMPHLLVAGATGTGKSVALNAMITSILYKATPEDVRFIMVDPKVLELSLYEGIPHLLLPVVTDPRKAQAALQWAVNEMEQRIRILYSAGVRNLDAYNRKVERHNAGELELEVRPRYKKVQVIDKTASAESAEAQEIEVRSNDGEARFEKKEKLPHIVIVIDELADLMMAASREVETNIARIAQKARAAGIHLIVATQRPSVNVITGLIKANLPARISFRVASKVDSRTILDANGAESLLGNGDMLFHPPTSSELVRVHGAFITENEIQRIVDHLKRQAEPVYDESILAAAEEGDPDGDSEDDEHMDALYDQAVALVAEARQASTSMIQRKLRIGYNRAARMIERMEREGIVGPPDGSRPREVLIQDHGP
ncbi:MAG: DNA translocase FtsK 4TM domain-containing protein [Deltaproteobacteria bacterium]|nr:DNA translocase FtsK 4TM domain-containing protein [Deltaproteobacteria bacterium]